MTLKLLSRPDCHLCREAEEMLRELGARFDTINVESDATLAGRYGDAIPVLLDGDVEVARAPMTRQSLRRALKGLGLEIAG